MLARNTSLESSSDSFFSIEVLEWLPEPNSFLLPPHIFQHTNATPRSNRNPPTPTTTPITMFRSLVERPPLLSSGADVANDPDSTEPDAFSDLALSLSLVAVLLEVADDSTSAERETIRV